MAKSKLVAEVGVEVHVEEVATMLQQQEPQNESSTMMRILRIKITN